MSLTLEDFYKKTKEQYKLSLQTKEKSLSKNISWVYLLEDINNCSFMRGGELIVTTGLNVKSDLQITEMVRKVYEYGACGIIFNIGMYVKELPDDIVKWGNEQGFPILTMPWEIHISDLMREYCNAILLEKRMQDIREDALLKVLRGEDFSEDIEILSQFLSFCIVAAEQPLTIPYYAFTKWKEHFFYVCKSVCNHTKGGHCGISCRIEKVEDIGKCGIQAYRAMQVSKIRDTPIEQFEKIGLYNAALAIEDMDVLKQAEKMLEPIEDEALFNTLRIYLEKNRSVQETADSLFLHRNTVNYRILKCKSLLPEDFETKPLEYLFAFYLHDCLRLRQSEDKIRTGY